MHFSKTFLQDTLLPWVKNKTQQLFFPEDTSPYDFTLDMNTNPKIDSTSEESTPENIEEQDKPQTIFPSIDVNLEYMKVAYNFMINSDIIVREFILNARNRQYKAFLVYIDGMIDSDSMNHYILTPLMLRNSANGYNGDQSRIISEAVTNNITVRKVKRFSIIDYIENCLLPENTVKKVRQFADVMDGVNAGNCALFIDTLDLAFDIEVKGFQQRGLESPNNEIVVRGAQVAFTENIRTNTSLLRRYINNESLIVENITVGRLSKTKCAVCYLKNVANSDLIAEVKYRVNNLNIDYLISSGQLEQLIQDNGNYSLPQLIATERPDKASNLLFGGRVAVIVNGSPYVLVVPGTFADFISSPEDMNLKHQYANALKFLRVLAFFISLLLPALYIALTNFHQEVIPTELLFAIVSSRETVPFPIIFEIIVMEISFELIREASLRVPSPIGPTIGIVGALILGQAAVEASVVSPVLIIIVALTAIASFAIPDFSLSFHCRIVRFIYIILGFFTGFLGIAAAIFVHLLILCNMKSFGVSYLAPYLSKTTHSGRGVILSPAWKREYRSNFLKTKRPREQEHISMSWKYPNQK